MNVYNIILHKSQKVEIAQISTNECIKKSATSIQCAKVYLAIKTNAAPTHATTWMDPENIVLSERSWSQTVTLCAVLFT